jgi:hypothetical protein
MRKTKPSMVYQIKVTLDNIRPPVWRRVLVPDKCTLLDLHDIIQDVFGWYDYHLHEFTIHGESYGDPANDEFDEFAIQDESKFKLQKLDFKEGSRFTYEYDFGDGWDHTLVVEKIFPPERGMKLPICIKGKRECPPEDVGGPWGYEGFLEAIRDPQNEEHESYIEWIGREFDPEAFDLDLINERLRQRAERNWPERGSSISEDEPPGEKSLFDSSRWINLLNEEGHKRAKELALRQDAVTFLTYVYENKVTGTQATGNLPLKAVEEIAARFVNPPELETNIGDTIFRFRNEQEVWPIYFVHVLAHSAGLISGGKSRRWRLAPPGEQFLALPAVDQVWLLFTAWWYRVNWLIATSYDIFGGALPEAFSKIVATVLRELPIGEPILFETFADRIIQEVGWSWEKKEYDNTLTILRVTIEHCVIDPLKDFGFFSTQYEKNPTTGFQKLISFSMTSFGHALIASL